MFMLPIFLCVFSFGSRFFVTLLFSFFVHVVVFLYDTIEFIAHQRLPTVNDYRSYFRFLFIFFPLLSFFSVVSYTHICIYIFILFCFMKLTTHKVHLDYNKFYRFFLRIRSFRKSNSNLIFVLSRINGIEEKHTHSLMYVCFNKQKLRSIFIFITLLLFTGSAFCRCAIMSLLGSFWQTIDKHVWKFRIRIYIMNAAVRI